MADENGVTNEEVDITQNISKNSLDQTPMSPETGTYGDTDDELELPSLQIKNFNQFADIIMAYGMYVFEDMETPIPLLEFIVKKVIP
jgi:hypothetical protein